MAAIKRGVFALFSSAGILDGKREMGLESLSAGNPKNKHRCEYTWQGKAVSPESKVTFGVPNCVIYCKPATGEYRYNKMFAKYFEGKPVGKKCSCQNTQGEELFKMPGACPKDVADKCYADYLIQATDEYTEEYNKNSARVVHHSELYHETTFKSECQENACPDGDCFNVSVPFLEQTHTEREKHIRAKVVKQAAMKGSKALTRDQREMVEKMGQGELQDMIEMALADEAPERQDELRKRLEALAKRAEEGQVVVAPSDASKSKPKAEEEKEAYKSIASDGELTVGQLKEAYTSALEWNPLAKLISVNHLATVAGLTDDSHKVSLEDFHRFVEPECP
eukprot:TRINITY_DN3925_c0_g1_i1.p1 TRINITY_DN3925_c0_g1~~TRINITY_DN3925_c0_g1_i1.p1  ORF type:complete len:362 (+),score=81.22 TRINITY_DN3925_c0_g1_i1:77-1087(+)